MPFTFNYEDNMYPATDFNQINLDWILQLAQQLKETAESGGFDGAPGEPGTATNGIAFFDLTTATFADMTAAIADGQLPVLTYYVGGTPTYLYCYSRSNTMLYFIGFYGNTQYRVNWASDDMPATYVSTFVSNQSPTFYGNPTVPTQAAGNSSDRIANTQFVQNAVSVAVQAAIEQLVIAPFSESFKQALLQIARKVAYIDSNGQTYYQALYDALYPPINVDHITAVWNPPVGYVVYTNTTLDSLKDYLTVTATYDDQTSATLDSDEYVLSGSLTVGTSTITVTYADATTTFTVTVVDNVVESITAIFTQGANVIYDTYLLDTLIPYLSVTATWSNGTTAAVSDTDYVLSGTLVEGTSTITVTYEGESDTFTVTVSARIPSEYKQVEYLQSSGSQAIITDIVPRNTRTVITFEFTQYTSSQNQDNAVCAVFNDNNQRYYPAWLDSDGHICFHNRSNTSKWSGPINPSGKHTIDYNNASHQAIYDDTVRATDTTFSLTGGSNKLALFGRKNNTTVVALGYAKIYECVLYNNADSSVIGNFIPCYRKADSVPGMYDTVTETFYTDAMSSVTPFTVGSGAWET